MFSFLFNPFFILPMILVAWAQMRVRSAFKKYSQVASAARLSGAETARRILQQQGIYDVAVEETGGMLSDHYDPRAKAVAPLFGQLPRAPSSRLGRGGARGRPRDPTRPRLRAAQLSPRDPARRQLGLDAGLPLILAGMFFGPPA